MKNITSILVVSAALSACSPEIPGEQSLQVQNDICTKISEIPEVTKIMNWKWGLSTAFIAMQHTEDSFFTRSQPQSWMSIRYWESKYVPINLPNETSYKISTILGLQNKFGCKLEYSGNISATPYFFQEKTASEKLTDRINSWNSDFQYTPPKKL